MRFFHSCSERICFPRSLLRIHLDSSVCRARKVASRHTRRPSDFMIRFDNSNTSRASQSDKWCNKPLQRTRSADPKYELFWFTKSCAVPRKKVPPAANLLRAERIYSSLVSIPKYSISCGRYSRMFPDPQPMSTITSPLLGAQTFLTSHFLALSPPRNFWKSS